MTISELVNKYCFHDSTIERITYDKRTKEVILEITFCRWAQEWYNEKTDDEVETLILTFKNVSKTDCLDYKAGTYDQIISCVSIMDERFGEGIEFVNVTKDDCFITTIFADEVEIEHIENKIWNQPLVD